MEGTGATVIDAMELERWLVERVAREVGVDADRIDPQTPFAGLGLDSATAVQLTGELEELMAVRLDPTLVFEYPTIRRLAEHLEAVAREGRRRGREEDAR